MAKKKKGGQMKSETGNHTMIESPASAFGAAL
jgi:hypothetical protein